MIRLKYLRPTRIEEALGMLQTAVLLELSTLPPYLYALYTLKERVGPEGVIVNAAARGRLLATVLEEMLHMALACNVMNALGGDPKIADEKLLPTYPGPLPGDIGGLQVHLLPFSEKAMQQGMDIEEPADPLDIPVRKAAAMEEEPVFMTIGEFYEALDGFLAKLPPSAWHAGRNQLEDAQFFAGELFPVNGYTDANDAIQRIVSQGEGAADSPLDFEQEVAHFYRFQEMKLNKLLQKADNPVGYVYAGSFGVNYEDAYPAIPDPGTHDFSQDSEAARKAQDACNAAFTRMLVELGHAVSGEQGRLGNAVRAMFDLRMATRVALGTPLADGKSVAGPAFLFRPNLLGSTP